MRSETFYFISEEIRQSSTVRLLYAFQPSGCCPALKSMACGLHLVRSDIVESRGNADLKDESGTQRGNTHGGSTLHWGPFFEGNRYELTNGELCVLQIS